MGIWIYIFCRSIEPLTCGEVVDFVTNGCYFEFDPVFSSGTGSVDCEARAWALDIVYDPKKRPAQLSFGAADHVTIETIDELVNEYLPDTPTREQEIVVSMLRLTRQQLTIELGFNLPDDCWFMLDHLEAYVATKLKGVIYVHGVGVYGPDLTELWMFREPVE